VAPDPVVGGDVDHAEARVVGLQPEDGPRREERPGDLLPGGAEVTADEGVRRAAVRRTGGVGAGRVGGVQSRKKRAGAASTSLKESPLSVVRRTNPSCPVIARPCSSGWAETSDVWLSPISPESHTVFQLAPPSRDCRVKPLKIAVSPPDQTVRGSVGSISRQSSPLSAGRSLQVIPRSSDFQTPPPAANTVGPPGTPWTA